MKYYQYLDKLKDFDWNVEPNDSSSRFPNEITNRYQELPKEIIQFVTSFKTIASPDKKSWFLTVDDYSYTGDELYKWNEWELLSLESAEDDKELIEYIKGFWDYHFPIIFSVKNCYTYFAINLENYSIVCGGEPEFEETTYIAGSFEEFLNLLCNQNGKIKPYM